MTSNHEQIECWNGAVGERWAELQSALDRMLRPFGQVTLDGLALSAGAHVVDVGCGAGDSSLSIAERVGPSGSVLGVDVSSPLLALARERAGTRPGITFALGDAATQRFPGRFSAVHSRFGVMFFADPLVAFRNLATALSDDGRLAFCCWRDRLDNPWCQLPLEIVRRHVAVAPDLKHPRAPGPFAFAEPDYVRDILQNAGFEDVTLQRVDRAMPLSNAGVRDAANLLVRVGPASSLLADQAPATRERVRDDIAGALSRIAHGDAVSLEGSAWLVLARARHRR